LLNSYYQEDGSFVEFDEFEEETLKTLSENFAKRVLSKLVKLDLVDPDASESLLQQEHTGFSVWVGDRIDGTDEERIKFLTRYIERAPISLEKVSLQGDMVLVKSSNEMIPDANMTPLEFLAKLSLQIPNLHECTLRYYGALSYRKRGEKIKHETARKLSEAEQLLIMENSMSELEPRKYASPTWAECIRKTFELDPLLCPKCGGVMQIKSAIKDEAEIQSLANELGGYESYHPPPPIEAKIFDVVYDDLAYCE
jgi:hypothetical protein